MSSDSDSTPSQDATSDPSDARWRTLHHTEREWDEMSSHIIRLYLSEQLTLGEVMRVMETQYNFRASQSMYKKRISRWQLHKYKPRTRPNAARQKSLQASGRTQGTMAVRLESPTIVPPRLKDAAEDKTVQDLLTSLRRLTLLHYTPDQNRPPEIGVGTPSGILVISQMYMTFSLGSTLFARGYGHLAGKALRMSFLILEDIIRGQHFGLDWLLLDVLYDFVARGQYALYSTLVTYLANIAEALLPRSHPLHHIAAALMRYGYQENADVPTLLQRAFFSQIDAVQSDTEVRSTLSAMNARVRQFLIPDEQPSVADDKLQSVRQGIQAIHFDIETQKDWGTDHQTQKKKKAKKKETNKQQLPSPRSSPSSPSPSTPSSSSSPRSPPIPMLPALATNRTGANDEPLLLRDFIETRTKRSLSRMDKKLDLLTLGVADRLYWSEYFPELIELYSTKAEAFEQERAGSWDAAIITQRRLIDMFKERFSMDVWGTIRELFALERLLEKAGATEAEITEVRDDALARATKLLLTIPDDVP
ncbi:hypothetical protein F5Y16DRAFT_98647 [Xylariaceae sp. FL0255]|nr:hypothetical protein F5Y16DRAFT_98647 [Xylariaceae sp. FL0255]